MAHAYTPEAIARCVRLGVRSIEHGNGLDAPTAAAMAAAGAHLSQTVVTYAALVEEGAAGGMPRELVAKVGRRRRPRDEGCARGRVPRTILRRGAPPSRPLVIVYRE